MKEIFDDTKKKFVFYLNTTVQQTLSTGDGD